MTTSYRVLVSRVSTPEGEWLQDDEISGSDLSDTTIEWLVNGERVEPVEDSGTYEHACPECDKTYDSQGWLDRHIESKHADEDED